MNEKTVIITGASSGIGKAATIKFAKEGYQVVMACRNLEKSKKVQQQVIELTENRNVELLELDISSFESIKKFCSTFKNKYQKLDILIHNAAYFNHSEKNYQLSRDGIELTFATNTVGPFLMTQLLLELLRKSDDARILNACSTNIRHYFDLKRKIDFDNLQGEFKDKRPYNVYKMYGDSKMALLMLTFKMAGQFKNEGIKVNAIQIPAIKISRETKQQLKSAWRIAAMIQSAAGALPETMADTYFHICTSGGFKDVTGKLINEKREVVQSTHYKIGFIPEIKQFFDKGVYPKYADNIENVNKIYERCIYLIKSCINVSQ